MRLATLQHDDGVTLRDVLTVLQRAELVTRVGDEVERHLFGPGSEGPPDRLRLEKTVMGVASGRGALLREYVAELGDGAPAVALEAVRRLAHRDLLDLGVLAEALGHDRDASALDRRVAPQSGGPTVGAREPAVVRPLAGRSSGSGSECVPCVAIGQSKCSSSHSGSAQLVMPIGLPSRHPTIHPDTPVPSLQAVSPTRNLLFCHVRTRPAAGISENPSPTSVVSHSAHARRRAAESTDVPSNDIMT